MRRREVAVMLAGAAWALGAWAQQRDRMPRVGAIMAMAENDPQGQLNVAAFERGLLELGLMNGRNFQIDYRFGASQPGRTQAAVADMLSVAPDVIMAHGTAITAELQRHTSTVPVVFTV